MSRGKHAERTSAPLFAPMPLEPRLMLSAGLVVPILNSLPSAAAQLYLDFDGDAGGKWETYSVPATPAYDRDGDPTTFSDNEVTAIREIWAQVAAKYSPFKLNVTTADPGTPADRKSLRVVIGGDGAWSGETSGGLAYVGGFYNSSSNTVFVFSENLGSGYPKYVADAAAHEAGHGFGLEHQSLYNSDGTLAEEYYAGDGTVAPIMGSSYDARGLWWNGSSTSAETQQDDLTILSGSANGFGYRPDDHGGTLASATDLSIASGSFSAGGVIEKTSDSDFFRFTISAGTVTFSIDADAYGPDITAELHRSDGRLVVRADSTSLGEELEANLSAGSYMLVVRSAGRYGEVGQYTVNGTFAPAAPVMPAPSDLVASLAEDDSANLTWIDNSAEEKGFQIQRSLDGGATWDDLAIVAADTAAYTDSTLPAGATALYRVYGFNDAGMSDVSSVAGVTKAPAAPLGLTATPLSSRRIRLTWDASPGADSYIVERSLDGDTWDKVRVVDGLIAPSTHLDPRTRYLFRVRALNAGGDSEYSEVGSARTFSAAHIPAAPRFVREVLLGGSQLLLRWRDRSPNEWGFRLQWSADGRKWQSIGRIRADHTSIGVNVRKSGKSFFRLNAYNRSGASRFSRVLAVRTRLPEHRSPTGSPVQLFSTKRIARILTWLG